MLRWNDCFRSPRWFTSTERMRRKNERMEKKRSKHMEKSDWQRGTTLGKCHIMDVGRWDMLSIMSLKCTRAHTHMQTWAPDMPFQLWHCSCTLHTYNPFSFIYLLKSIHLYRACDGSVRDVSVRDGSVRDGSVRVYTCWKWPLLHCILLCALTVQSKYRIKDWIKLCNDDRKQ